MSPSQLRKLYEEEAGFSLEIGNFAILTRLDGMPYRREYAFETTYVHWLERKLLEALACLPGLERQ